MTESQLKRPKLRWWLLLVGTLAALQYAGRFAGGPTDRNALYKYSTAVGAAVEFVIILALVLLMAWPRTELLALRRPKSWLRAIGIALLLFVCVYVVVALIDPLLHGGREQGLTPTRWMPSHAGAFAANFVLVAGAAPAVEELTFRGLGYSLLERYGKWTAIVLVGICFAAAHGLLQAFPELLIVGSALAWLRSYTKSIFPGMLVHAAFNSLALVLAVTT